MNVDFAALGQHLEQMFTSDRTGVLLEHAQPAIDDIPYESMEASLLRVARKDWNKARTLSVSLVTESTRHAALAHDVWVRAREEDDYATFAPSLEMTVELSRRVADCLPRSSARHEGGWHVRLISCSRSE